MTDRITPEKTEADETTGPLKEIFSSVRGVLSRHRMGVARRAATGKLKLDLYQLKRDRTRLLERLGRETFHLLEEARLPGLVELMKPYGKIRELDQQIQDLEAAIAGEGLGEAEASPESPSAADGAPELPSDSSPGSTSEQ